MKNIFLKSTVTLFVAFVMVISVLGTDVNATTSKCIRRGCYRDVTHGCYCSIHGKTPTYNTKSNSSSSSKNKYSSSYSYNKKYGTSNKKSSSSKSKSSKKSSGKKTYYDSYDDGYEDIWLNDDYDYDRYYRDSDYAAGVDDAMDEFDW